MAWLIKTWIAAMLVLLETSLAPGATPSAPIPLGQRDFLPSPEHPIGFRGDGSGVFPGAQPVTEWDEASGRNILWKTPIPWGYGSPVVVRDKVFVPADPDALLCINARDGKVLWRKDLGLGVSAQKGFSKE